MSRFSDSRLLKSSLTAGVMAVCASCLGGGEMAGTPELAPVPQGPGIAPAGVAGGLYNEYNSYGAYVRRSYMPGYIPQTDSLFENPRTLPASLCKFSDYYRSANVNGWFFASPRGYQSSVPPGSTSHAFMTGQLGITSSLQYGYPRGMRVIEPVVVPFASYTEPGGLLITNDGLAVRSMAPPPAPVTVTQTVEQTQTIEKTGPPPGLTPLTPAPPAVPSMPALPEVIDK